MVTTSLLVLSIFLNIFLIWYSRSTLYNLLYLSGNLKDLYDIISDYGKHLNTVYELERFYGDPTLTHLLEHTKELLKEMDKFDKIFLLVSDDKDEDYREEQEEEEENDN